MYDSKRAAAALNVTERTLQKWAKAGRLGFETIRKHGGGVKRLYKGEDVQRVKKENADGAVVVVPKSLTMVPKANPKQLASAAEKALALFKHYVAVERNGNGNGHTSSAEALHVDLTKKIWLTWDEAVALSGIPMTQLIKEAKEGKGIVAKRFGRSWRVLRKSLEEWSG